MRRFRTKCAAVVWAAARRRWPSARSPVTIVDSYSRPSCLRSSACSRLSSLALEKMP
jgi:hypothetical protein